MNLTDYKNYTLIQEPIYLITTRSQQVLETKFTQ